VIKFLSLDPKIWVMVHNHDSFGNRWDIFEDINNFHNKAASASVRLWLNNKYDIAVVSVNNKDDQYFKGYLEFLRGQNGTFQKPIDFPGSGHILAQVTVNSIG